MAKKTCRECHGPARGRGYTHAKGCSLDPKNAGTGKKGTRTRGPRSGGTVTKERLTAMSVDELLKLRADIDETLVSKTPEFEADLAKRGEILKALKKL